MIVVVIVFLMCFSSVSCCAHYCCHSFLRRDGGLERLAFEDHLHSYEEFTRLAERERERERERDRESERDLLAHPSIHPASLPPWRVPVLA